MPHSTDSAVSAVDWIFSGKYRDRMSSRSTLAIIVCAPAILGFSACKSVYTDTFSYKKNSFKAPVEKVPEIKAPDVPILPPAGLMPGGVLPPAGGGIPGAPAPEAGAIPGIPGAPAAPGAPAVPGAPPAVPGL